MSKYCKLFSISIVHEYFNFGIDPNIQLVPKGKCREILNKYDFMLMQENFCVICYVNQEKDVKEYLNYISSITGLEAFEFAVQVNSESFFCYTSISGNTKLIYSDQNQDNLIDGSRIQLLEKQVQSDQNSAISISISLDGISLDHPKEFNIKLNSRKTRRDYYIINSSGVNVEHVAIEGEAVFQKEAVRSLANGQQATPFIMQGQGMPLKRKEDFQFNLIKTEEKEGENGSVKRKKILFKGLPQPDPCHLEIIEREGIKQFVSPIYVYI